MPDLHLPAEAAFGLFPEPIACCQDNRILYRNDAFRTAFPELELSGVIPERWGELTPGTAGMLGEWNLLCQEWEGVLILRLSPNRDSPMLPDRKLPLLTTRIRLPLSLMLLAQERLERACGAFLQGTIQTELASMNRSRMQLVRLCRTLELASMADGEVPFDYTPQLIDLNGLCHTTAEELSDLLPETGCQLTFRPANTNLFVMCDDMLVQTLLFHLVSNAVKSTGPGGHLELRLERRGKMALISLSDDGRGMTPRQLASAFDPSVGGAGMEDAMQGLGVGLIACSRIARIHEGTLLLSNRSPKGLRATFSLPLCADGASVPLLTPRLFDSSGGIPLVLRELCDILPASCYREL